MRRSEWFALGLVLSLIAATYLLDRYHERVREAFAVRLVKASETLPQPEERPTRPLQVYTSKRSYYRYELVEILADYRPDLRTPASNGTLSAKVYVNNRLVKTVADMSEVPLTWDSESKLWRGRFPIPWNPPLGDYEVLVTAQPDNPGAVLKATASFQVVGREPPAVPAGLTVIAVENYSDLNVRKLPGLDGTPGDYRRIVDWAEYMGADAVFCLAGMTDGTPRYDRSGRLLPFRPDILHFTKLISAEAKRRGLLYGAWVMSFMMQVRNFEKFGYRPSIGYDHTTGLLTHSYHISIGDRKRLDDLVEVVKELDRNPNIDYIGLDYIRTGHVDGYELVDEVVADMSIPVPPNWDRMGPRERIVWFARKIKVEKDESVIEKWRWWRAHKVALNVKEVIERSGTRKPVWLFTLGWEHGKQHGQDPLMFNDAGITYDAVMLYEANQQQFRQVLVDWRKYLRARQVNILCGNSVDITLLDSPVLTPPEEIVRRTVAGSQQLLFGGLTDGVFWHDLTRAFWGRKGEYSTKEWAVTGGTCFSRYREDKGLSPVALKVRTDGFAPPGTPVKVAVEVENISLDPVRDLRVNLEALEGFAPTPPAETLIPELRPGETFSCEFEGRFHSVPGKTRSFGMVAVRAVAPGRKPHFNFQIVRIRRISGDAIASSPSVSTQQDDPSVIRIKDDPGLELPLPDQTP